MALPEGVKARITSLTKRLHICVALLKRLSKTDSDKYEKIRKKDFISVFRDTCALVRESETNNWPYHLELLEAAHKLLNEGIRIAYGSGDLYDFMPSWAHDKEGDRPLIKDREEVKVGLPHGAVAELMRIRRMTDEEAWEIKPKPWNPSLKPHPMSTSLARFRPNLPTLTPTSANPLALSVCEARCEISSSRTPSPLRIKLSSENSCLAMTTMGGWKNRSPALECFLLDKDDDKRTGFMAGNFLVPGLADIAYHMGVDENRRLVFVGDESRVKSYVWMNPNGTYSDKLLPVHTLDADHSSGPITVLPNGTIVRAGRGGADVWAVDGLPTHGDGGDEIIGEEMDLDDLDTMRDDPEDVELSTGASPTSRITFVDHPNLKPSIWQPLMESPSTVLCVENARETNNYGCVAIDLEAGGKTATRYLGHGATVADISVSAADPRMFLTACHDGFSRLYDVRQALPVLTFDACGQSEFCDAAVLAHPDGIPMVFTGTHKEERIKLWDARARTAVCDLATGNNAVQSLAWDSKRNCLYAATECNYMDRHGYRHGYRRAKIPRRRNNDGSNDNSKYEGDGFEERCWPSEAWHGEDYFEYAYDAGEHTLFRYAFKENPDTSKVPEYGDAGLNEGW